jgi:hypothetical protein
MNIKYVSVTPSLSSIDYELLFTFSISEIEKNKIPLSVNGILLSEDGKKIGDLRIHDHNFSSTQWVNADGARGVRMSNACQFTLSCQLSEKSINHIEKFRFNNKELTRDVVLIVKLSIHELESNVQMGTFVLGDEMDEPGRTNRVRTVYHEYTGEFGASTSNMWILSGNSGPNYLGHRRHALPEIRVTIDLMQWKNAFTEYLKIGKIMVYEFLVPSEIKFSKPLKERYDRGQQSLKDMQVQLGYGEWETAIIVSRPIFELFKNFDDFKKVLIDGGYSELAYQDLKNSIVSFFDLLSKIYHGLGKGKDKDNVNPKIPVNKEDAYMVYSFSLSIFQLISQKVIR